MAKNRKKQVKSEEVEAEQIEVKRAKKVDPVVELEQEEAAEIRAEQEAEEIETKKPKRKGARTSKAKAKRVEAEVPQAEASEEKSEKKVAKWRERLRDKRAAKKTVRRERHKWTMPIWLRISASVLLIAGLSIVFTWYILWRSNLCDAQVTNEFIGEKPRVFTYSCLIIFSLMASLAAVTWRPFLSIGISFAAFSVLSYIQMEKYRIRGIPLLPEDFLLAGNAGEVAQFADEDSIRRLVFGVIFILVGSALLEHCARRVLGRNTHKGAWWERYSLIPHMTFALVSLAMLAMVVTPVIQRKNMEWIADEAELVEWDQTQNYEQNGFILGFTYNLGRLEIAKPEDYSENRMREIAEKYRALRAADTERVPLTEIADNVVVVLDETFYDPALLTKYYRQNGGDVTPNLHRIFRNYPSGYMYSPEYGGGTANVEFAVLTGLSNYWAGIIPYVNSVSKLEKRLSVASWAKDYGLETTAVHAYDGSMYKRDLVYPRLGIDLFLDWKDMKYQEHDYKSAYINDKSTYNEVLDILEDNDGKPQMVLAVTMMNHASYDTAQYPKLEFMVRGKENTLLAHSYQSLHMADKYLGEFLEEVDELEERTVVLWFGDHAAGILDDYYKSEDKSDRDLAQLTPYFIYANFDIESLWTVRETAKINEELGFEYPVRGVDLPTTTPNCLLNTMYNILGVEKPALFYLVDEVCAETPILMSKYFAGDLPEETEALLEYQLVNYDVLAGKHYWDGE